MSSLVIPICSFHVFLLCAVRVLKSVWIGHADKGRVVLCSILSPTQACSLQKPLQQFMPLFPYEVPLTSVRLKFKWLVQPKLHQEVSFWHPLPCHVLFQDCWGDYIVVYLDVFQCSTSTGLRRKMLFLCPSLVPLPCSLEGSKCFMHKTLAHLFLRIC